MNKASGRYAYLIVMSVIWLLLALMPPLGPYHHSGSLFSSWKEFLAVGVLPLLVFWGGILIYKIRNKSC